MTAQHPMSLHRHLDRAGRLFPDGVTATVADDDHTILVTISRADTARTGARPGDPLTVVAVEGEIDQDTAPLLRLALSQALDGRAPVCCDLSRVTFFGAAAVSTVLAARRQATALGQVFFLRGVQGVTDRVLTVVDPDRVVAR
jgi:anti-anti-sigma factor